MSLSTMSIKKTVMEKMKKQIIDDMNPSLYSSVNPYDLALEEENKLILEMYPMLQSHINDIPVFPAAYKKGAIPTWVPQEYTNFQNDHLPSRPRKEEFDNLFMQLHNHSLNLASLVIPAHKTSQRPLPNLAVTPVAPLKVVPPQLPCAQNVESSSEPAKTAHRVKFEKKIAPPGSKTAPNPKKTKDEKEMPGQDTYHVIRISQDNGRRYLELLRQNSDGYIIAWRILLDLDDLVTPYWCFFSDFAYLRSFLTFLDMRILTYESGYDNLDDIHYYNGILDEIIDKFLVRLYANPQLTSTDAGKIHFYILCFLFGETPRLGAVKTFLDSKLRISKADYLLAKERHRFGNLLDRLVKSWSNTCDTAFILLLAELEGVIREFIISPSLLAVFDSNKANANFRCELAMREFSGIFGLVKDIDSSGKAQKYGVIALYQLLHNELFLMKHRPGLITSLILRKGQFRKEINLPTSKKEPQPIVGPAKSADFMFWEFFDKIAQIKKVPHFLALIFLDEAIPFLSEFRLLHGDIFDEILQKCNNFLTLGLLRKRKLDAAAKLAWGGGIISDPKLTNTQFSSWQEGYGYGSINLS